MEKGSTRQRLLDAALRLIWESSYGSVGVDEICHLADVKKGSFYHAFKSKSDLAAAAFEYYWDRKRPLYDQVFSPLRSPLDRLKGYCQAIVEDQQKKHQSLGKVLGCPFNSVGCELSTQDENIRQKSRELSDRVVKYIESAVRDLMGDGLIGVGDAAELAREIYAYTCGVLTQAKISNDINSLERLAPGMCRLLSLKSFTPN